MKTRRIRIATTLVAAVAALSMAAPSPAHASNCSGKFSETCIWLTNQWCYLTGKCL